MLETRINVLISYSFSGYDMMYAETISKGTAIECQVEKKFQRRQIYILQFRRANGGETNANVYGTFR
jgi:hypothetical protein